MKIDFRRRFRKMGFGGLLGWVGLVSFGALAPLPAWAFSIAPELTPRVSTFARPVTLYNYATRAGAGLPPRGVIEPWSGKPSQYVYRQVDLFWKQPTSRGLPTGLYLATDPVYTSAYGGDKDDWALFQIDVFAGFRVLDIRGDFSHGLRRVGQGEFSRATLARLASAGCEDTNVNALFLDVGNPACWAVVLDTLRELQVDGILYDYAAVKFRQCPLRTSVPEVNPAILLTRKNRVTPAQVKLFVKEIPRWDLLRRDRLMVQSLFHEAELSGWPRKARWTAPELGMPTLPSADAFMRDRLIGCGGHPEDLPTRVATLDADLRPHVQALARSTTLYRWIPREAAQLPATGWLTAGLEPWSSRINGYMSGELERVLHYSRPQDALPLGSGLYLAPDPVVSRADGGAHWLLASLTADPGGRLKTQKNPEDRQIRYLDLRPAGIPLSGGGLIQLAGAGCARPGPTFADLLRPDAPEACRKVAIDSLRALGVSLVAFADPAAANLPACADPRRGQVRFLAVDPDRFMITFASDFLLDALPTDPPAESGDIGDRPALSTLRQQVLINGIFAAEGVATPATAAALPWPGLMALPAAPAAQWMRANLFGCDAAVAETAAEISGETAGEDK